MPNRFKIEMGVGLSILALLVLGQPMVARAQRSFRATDPGVRTGSPAAGDPLPGLTPAELEMFEVGKEDFEEAEGVGDGLGPRFNLDSCGGCHSQPAIGGTSPAVNPQFTLATAYGARNSAPLPSGASASASSSSTMAGRRTWWRRSGPTRAGSMGVSRPPRQTTWSPASNVSASLRSGTC